MRNEDLIQELEKFDEKLKESLDNEEKLFVDTEIFVGCTGCNGTQMCSEIM